MRSPRQASGLVIEKLLEESLVMVSTSPRDGGNWRDDAIFVDWGASFREQHNPHFPETAPPGIIAASESED